MQFAVGESYSFNKMRIAGFCLVRCVATSTDITLHVGVVAASALITSCRVSWRWQKVWNVHATTSPNWHLANSAHHGLQTFYFLQKLQAARGRVSRNRLLSRINKQSQQRLIVGFGFWNTTERNYCKSILPAQIKWVSKRLSRSGERATDNWR